MPDENNDLKDGEQKTPEGNDQPENKEHADPEIEALESEIDAMIGNDDDDDKGDDKDDDDEDADDLSEEDAAKMKSDNKNYKKGLKSVKAKLKQIKDARKKEQQKKKPEEKKPDDKKGDDEQPLTKADLKKSDQQKVENAAVAELEGESEVFKEHKSEIMKFYTPRRGNETEDGAAKDLDDALTLFLKRNPKLKEKHDEDTKATADLSTGANPQGGKKGDGKKGDRKRILPKSKTPDKWY